ncbi:DMT family transporter [Acinetobacter qingfengensis]|uniref:Multidrug DMT transporter n=2 Tax=Acinetobacter qingfengensis TaxID=1262585 RepID=A0A1E7RDF2_9GAMM|nr:DMT family transporter [Acinetobacter qingfengensis]OEY97282.1 multidrug DMT transporter [Acinetobacter qingfengensis]
MSWGIYLLPVLTILIWAINIVVTRYAVDFIAPISISFYRWLIAWLVLTPFLFFKVVRQWHDIKPLLGQLAILGLLGMVCYQGLAYSAAHFTTATNMGIINGCLPVFSILFSVFFLKIIPSRLAVVGTILSIFGLIYLITQGNFQQLLNGQHLKGDLLMILAIGLYAFYGIFLQRWKIKLALPLMLYLQICFAVVFHVPLLMYTGLDALNSQNIWSVLYAALLPSIVAPFVWMICIQKLGSNSTSIYMNLIPVFTAIIAWVFLGESWTVYHTIGGIMVLLGVFLAQRR